MILEPTSTILPDDIILGSQDILDLGLDEAPEDIGPSAEEIAAGQRGGHHHG